MSHLHGIGFLLFGSGLLLTLALAGALPAFAQSVQVVATDPLPDRVLDRGEPLYVHLRYASEQPVRFRARGRFFGIERTAGSQTNPAPAYPAGDGDALVWIAYVEPTVVDEILIQAYDDRWQPIAQMAWPLVMEWRGVAGHSPRATPEWASRLSAAQQQMVTAAPREDPGMGWTLLFMLAGWSIPGYVVLQIIALRRWRDRWRTAAMLPLWVTVPVLGYTMLAALKGSNLFPVIMLFTYPCAFLYLAGVAVTRRMRAVYA
jgi:hypothetical protein